MKSEQFLLSLQAHAESFAKAVATNEGEWIVKGFIDVYRRIYTISVDTKLFQKCSNCSFSRCSSSSERSMDSKLSCARSRIFILI